MLHLPEELNGAYAQARRASMDSKPHHAAPVTNFVYTVVIMAVISGFLMGYNTGVMSNSLLYINDVKYDLEYDTHKLVAGITLASCAVFSLVAGWVSGSFGRKRTILLSSVLFTVGTIVHAATVDTAMLIVGRIVVGAAIGFASVSVPIYIAEISPMDVRGQMVTGFQWMVTFGIFISSIVGALFGIPFDPEFPAKIGWRCTIGLAAIPSIIQFVCCFVMPESPRWLFEVGKPEKAFDVLRDMYENDERWAQYDYKEIIKARASSKARSFGVIGVFATSHVRKALIIGCLMQIFQQLSGINTLTYYTETILRMAGDRDSFALIWLTCVVTLVNFAFTAVAMTLVERLGRRKLLLLSILGVIVGLIILAVGFLLIHNSSVKIGYDHYLKAQDYIHNSTKLQDAVNKCSKPTDCDSCVTIETCGFCFPQGTASQGICLPLQLPHTDYSWIGNCTNVANDGYSGSFVWASDWCESDSRWVPVVGMIIFLIFFSIGMAPIPWVVNAEIYPTWARSTGAGIATFFNWGFNLLISQTFLLLTGSIMKYGAFFVYLGITVFSLLLFFFIVPETGKLQLEEVEMVLMNEYERTLMTRTSRLTEMSENSRSDSFETKF